MQKKFYITTPIYYPSGHWHLGHCYTTVFSDVEARFHRLEGDDVFFLTGTDDHGQKIEKNAEAQGITPMEFVNPLVDEIKELWSKLNISYNKFIRTTDAQHVQTVQNIFKKLYDQGDIYKASYSGWYCTPCESFWTENQLVDGKCPDCGREVSLEHEESYFFRLSKYADKVEELLLSGKFLKPDSRVKEMVQNFLHGKDGLKDLCVSRSSITWGVPVTFDPGHVVYVWIDALSNYVSALGYMNDGENLFDRYWPASLHVMAKEIVRFHSIIWPAILIALGLELPEAEYGHGWLLLNGGKMSKSKGGTQDPRELCDIFGVDAIRYYLLSCLPYGQDGQYSSELMIDKINTDLVNDLGNLVSRTSAMTVQYFQGNVPASGELDDSDKDLISVATGAYSKIKQALNDCQMTKALEELIAISSKCNKYIDINAPWALAKDETKRGRLQTVIYNLNESIRYLAVLMQPFMPDTANKIFQILGIDDSLKTLDSLKDFGGIQAGTLVTKQPALFPRINKAEALKKIG